MIGGYKVADYASLIRPTRFTQSRHFETLLNGNDPKLRDACLKLALSNA